MKERNLNSNVVTSTVNMAITSQKYIQMIIAAVIMLLLTQTVSAQYLVGRSVENRPIYSYSIQGEGPAITQTGAGSSNRNVIVIGGIHGGYEWNSVVLAQSMLEYYREHPVDIPSDVTLHIVPVLNPDGLYSIAGTADPQGLNTDALRLSWEELVPGRLNANGVDLNRNFDDEWQSIGYHGQREVDAGSAPFSEPESRAVVELVERLEPSVVLFLHSASNNIWYGGLFDSWEPARRLARAYSQTSGYVIHEASYNSEDSAPAQPPQFPITGTATGYLYRNGIPGLTIELANRYDSEVQRNLNGLNALMRQLQ